MRNPFNSWLLAFGLLLTTTPPAHAQFTNPYTGRTFNNPMSSFIDTVILNNQRSMMLRSSLMSSMAIQQGLSRKRPRYTKAQKQAADKYAKYHGTMFKRAAPVMPARLAATFVPEPGEQRDDMAKLFAGLLKIYDDRSRQQAAPPNDLARTLAYVIALNYAYAREQDVSADGLAAMRAKIRASLLANPEFRQTSDRKKQEMHETLVILGHFVALGYDHSKGQNDKEGMAAFKKLANFNLKSLLSVEPSRIRLEKDGLVII